MRRDVTVVIPSIAARPQLLARAIASALSQTEPIASLSIAIDSNHDGAWVTRNRAMRAVTSEWTVFLDDDDQLLPHFTSYLLDRAEEHDLDLTWGWFQVVGGTDPFPQHRGRQYDPADPHIFPISVLVRTACLHQAFDEMGGFQPDVLGDWGHQDRPVWDWFAANCRMQGFEEIVWLWHHHGANTSGLPTRW